jgi:cytoskeletal protein CcmA (bactofilin family)
MFGRKVEQQTLDIDSLVGENIKIIGKIEGSGNLRIDGIIEGDINYKGNLSIGETGKVKGNISCTDISLAGTVEGNIKSNAKLNLLPTGKLIGDAEVSSLIVHENAFFEGSCKMVDINSNVKTLNIKDTEKVK